MKIIKLENLICLTIVTLPLYLVKVNFWGVPTNILEILMGIAIVWAFFRWDKGLWRKNFQPYKVEIILFFLIFLGLVASLLFNDNQWRGLGIIKSWFILPALFSWVACCSLPREKKKNIFIALYLSAFLTALVALGYLLLVKVTFDGRLEAIFDSPNYLAMYLAPGIIIGIIMLAQSQISNLKSQICNSKLKKIIVYTSLMLIIIALYFTYSYAAWISVLLALVITFLLDNKFSKKYLIISGAIVLVLIFLLKDTAKFKDLVSLNQRSSLASRIMIWQSSGKILSDNWLLGIGPGNFQDKYLEYQKYFPPYLEWAVPHPHNLYLAFWLYGGLVGLVSFLVILYFFFKKVETPKLGVSTGVKYIALGVMIYVLLHGLVDTTIFKNDLAVVFWLTYFSIK
jgi:O-antigen ligase